MATDRRAFLLAFPLLAAAAARCSRRDNDSPLRAAVRYLWAQQAEDGGFHSSTYGLLRSGQSLTPFVLDTLLDVPDSVWPAPRGDIGRALEFIRRNTDAGGAIGRMSGSPDYPNYATALAVTAIVKARPSGWDRDIAPMVAYLRSQQFDETNGWKPEDAPYGGWGMGGAVQRPPDAGHVDLSMTRCVLEALQAARLPSANEAMTRALAYLQRSQNPDGGFYFSPVNPEINKAGEANGAFLSYGTATADGVLALGAAGVPANDERVVKAMKWLNDHHQPDRAPGFDSTTSRESWGTGLRFYYASVISRAVPGLQVQLPAQAADGSFRNPNSLVKEDDPLIATTFAVQVMNS